MTDEFIDENEESRIIFCPVENGVQLKAMAIKLHVKFLVRIGEKK